MKLIKTVTDIIVLCQLLLTKRGFKISNDILGNISYRLNKIIDCIK